jgi:hypothetical protein
MHVFHAYAAYNPPFVRSIVPAEKDAFGEVENKSAIPESSPDTPEATTSGPPTSEDVYPTFTHIPPQSRQEVVHEVRALLQRILADLGEQDNELNETLPIEYKFQHVTLTTRLLNSYLAVFYRHSSLEESRDMFWGSSWITRSSPQRGT